MSNTILEDQSCQNCRFFIKHTLAHPNDRTKQWFGGDDGLYDIGSCRALPPTINTSKDVNGFSGMAVWPLSYAYEWCGNWEKAPEGHLMTVRACEDCDFYSRSDEEHRECRRHPPRYPRRVYNVDEVESADLWPIVYCEFWCGEFREKPVA